MAFTPKFVDLVKNQTSVQGTGPVALGNAVSGFIGFAEALNAGDQFYYCIQGVDKPQEREIGRGTMQADGKIARDAIGGGPTNFSNGNKTISLVASAEWYAAIEARSAGEPMAVATRALLAATPAPAAGAMRMLGEGRRRGLFRFDAANLSAAVALDSDQGLHVAPANDPTGASGAWVRQFDGPVMADWFGLAGDDATNDGPKVARLLDVIDKNATGYTGAPALHFGPRGYFLGTSTINIRAAMIIEGEGRLATKLRWAAGASGIRVARVNTADSTTGDVPAWSVGGGDNAIIRQLGLEGGYTNAEGEFHGIELRARASIADVQISGFQGDGIFSRAAAGGGPIEGNANCAQVGRVTVNHCRNGLYCDSADVNVWLVQGCDFSANRAWGVWDSSFLGNSYIGCHAAANGWDGALGAVPTACSYNNNRYAVLPGQETWCSANAPSGTSAHNQGWLFIGAGGPYNGVAPWADGTAFRAGGAYYLDGGGGNARNVMIGCYSEQDQNPAQIDGPAATFGGFQAAGMFCGTVRAAHYQAGEYTGNWGTTGNFVANGQYNRIGSDGSDGKTGDGIPLTVATPGYYPGMFFYSGANARIEGKIEPNGANFGLTSVVGKFVFANPGAIIATIDGGGLSIGNKRVIGPQQVRPATPTLADVVACLDAHGIWA